MNCTTVDGRHPANQLRLVVCPIYRVLKISGGAGLLPSTVSLIHTIQLVLLVVEEEGGTPKNTTNLKTHEKSAIKSNRPFFLMKL